MPRPRPRRTPERFLLAWLPFLCGAFAGGFALDSALVVLGNLLVGLPVAHVLAGSERTTSRLLRLLPRGVVLVLGVNVVVAVALFVADRV
jgi:hypothetical protein